jgi:hypothetical protein
MKEIPLTQGKVALVDDEDYEYLNQFKWCAHNRRNTSYAVRALPIDKNEKQNTIKMHRVIINTPKEMETDHINGNGLDNRRENLRIVTTRQNQQNLHIKKSSKYPGVCWEAGRSRWRSTIQIAGKLHTIGRFENEEDAATAYQKVCNDLMVKG